MAPLPNARQRWLLVSNCQVLGLGNCLNLLCDEVEVEHYDPAAFHRQSTALRERLGTYDCVLLAPQMQADLAIEKDQCRELWRVPTIAFNAYHPDLCYLLEGGKPLKGPMGDYHSLIAYAAFACGLTTRQAFSLYRSDIYAELGFFGRWDGERERLLQTFRDHGFPLDDTFSDWSRRGSFMYSINHPRIHCVRDVACSVLRRAGLAASYHDALPNDNLANGPIFPVYPEIASALGVHGSYLFKCAGRYRFLRLWDFIAESFDLYCGRNISILPMFQATLDKALLLLKAVA